ncbi:MAG: hypothetical protein PHX43_03390 [Alphaproteobacteria bacterium]|nr:hypothetical protein [Alphaproteobacteria bacterium]
MISASEVFDNSLNRNLIISAVLHVALLLVLYFGLPDLFKPPPGMIHPIVPIDIVDIGEITNTRIQSKTEEAAKPPEPQQKPAAPPTPTPPTTEPTPPTPPEAKAEEQVESIAPKPMQKPKPPEPAKPDKQQQDMLSSVLKNVAKLKQEAPKSEAKADSNIKEKEGGSGTGPSLSDRLTISEEDSLRRQISQCWNMPVGAREAENLIVEVLIEVNPDRTVRAAHVVDEMRMSSDRYFRAAAESALRALRHPRCSPLELNPDKYEQWKTIRFNFDPRDML